MKTDLADLRRYLPPEVKLLIGGGASAAYQSEIDAVGALRLNNLEELSPALNRLRSEAR